MPAQVFYELLRFNAADPDAMVRERARRRIGAGASDVRVSLRRTRRIQCRRGCLPPFAPTSMLSRPVSSVHLGESPEKSSSSDGHGAWRTARGARRVDGRVGSARHVAGRYLDRLGFLDRRVLRVMACSSTATTLDASRRAT
jgi:hypothetical protein